MSSNSTHVPPGFSTVTPYLTVQGAAQVLDFLKQVFDAEQLECMYNDNGTIAHAAVRIGGSTIELAEFKANWGPTPAALHIYVADTDAVYQRALQAGAESVYEPTDHYYGERGAGVKDHAGNNWYIATFIRNVSDEEIAKHQAEKAGQ